MTSRAAAVEFVGTAFLVAAVVGSGIMAERLAGGNQALALLANAIATGTVLMALILAFIDISGAHFNPAVTLAAATRGTFAWQRVPAYIGAQFAGGYLGTMAAHAMFALPLFELSDQGRTGPSQWLAEAIATFGLLAIIWGCVRRRADAVPYAVAGYITGAYWFTASTSFANPAVTVARVFTDTFAGIAPWDAPAFIACQILGALLATLFFQWLEPA